MQLGQVACISWESVRPKPVPDAVFVPALGGHVCSGDFIRYLHGDVGVIIDVRCNEGGRRESDGNNTSQKVCLNLWPCCASDLSYNNSQRPLFQLQQHNTPPEMYTGMVPEVFQSNVICWTDASSICGIAFVFHTDDIESGLYDCVGMADSFCVRYRYKRDAAFREILPVRDHFPFGGSFRFRLSTGIPLHPLPWHLWNGLSMIRSAVERLMNKCGKQSYSLRQANIPVSLLLWHFIKQKVEEHCTVDNLQVPDEVCCGTRTTPINRRYLTIDSRRQRQVTEWILFNSKQKLVAGRKIFGACFGLGVQSRPGRAPNLRVRDHVRTSSKKLKKHDNVNIVDVESDSENSTDDTNEEGTGKAKFCPRNRTNVSGNGLEFCYDINSESLTVIIRYSEYPACSDKIMSALGLGERYFLAEEDEEEKVDNVPPIVAGTRFEVGSVLYVVCLENAETGMVRCTVLETDEDDVANAHLSIGDEVAFERQAVLQGIRNRY